MNNPSAEGLPEGLERALDTYKPWQTNITPEVLRTSITGHNPKKGYPIACNGETRYFDPSESYFFFPRQEDSVLIKFSNFPHMLVPLQREKYGFSPNRTVRINPSRLDLDLSERARAVYEEILNSREMSITDLLEAVGFIVNHSMEYDFEKIRKQSGPFASKWDEAQKKYRPTGEEVTKGICVDAGKIIRSVLGSLGMEDRFFYTIEANPYGGAHDTTVVFDRVSGEWAVINSKSPTKPYNLTPKEKLTELGRPYVV